MSVGARRSGGLPQPQGAPLIGKARREIHEACDAIAAWQGSCASGVDQRRVEEGQRQSLADRALAAIVASGEFGDVGYGSLDQPIEP